MVTKDLQTLNLKFDQVMFNSLVFTWKRNFEVTFGNFSVSVSQINVLERYCCRRQPVFVALSNFADVLLTFCETAVFFVRHSEPITTMRQDDLLP